MAAKLDIPHSDFETSSRGTLTPSSAPRSPIVAAFCNARSGLNLLSLATAVTVLGLAARNLCVYNETHLADAFFLPLWPADLQKDCTLALVIVAALVVGFSAMGVAIGRSKNPGSLRFTILSLALPLASLIATIVAIVIHFTAQNSSSRYTLQTWSCQWKEVSMMTAPHFSQVCTEAKASIGLTVALAPLQVLVMASVVATFVAEKAVRWSEKK